MYGDWNFSNSFTNAKTYIFLLPCRTFKNYCGLLHGKYIVVLYIVMIVLHLKIALIQTARTRWQKVIHFWIMMSSTTGTRSFPSHSSWVSPHLVFLQLQTGRQPGFFRFLLGNLAFFHISLNNFQHIILSLSKVTFNHIQKNSTMVRRKGHPILG